MTSILKVQNIQYTDGDAALTIADGGGVTAAATLTSTANPGIIVNNNTLARVQLGNSTVGTGDSDGVQLQISGANGYVGSYDGTMNVFGGSNGTTATGLSVNANGIVTKPLTPRFSVYKSNSEQYINVSNSGSVNVPITWGTADTNVGNHFNTSTNRFTAPVTGTYRFDWAILTGLKIPSSGVYWVAYFTVKNGGSSYLNRTPGSPYTYEESYNSSGSSSAGEVTNSVGFKKVVGGGFADLTAGDYVELMAQCSNNSNVRVHSGVHSTFSGYLIG